MDELETEASGRNLIVFKAAQIRKNPHSFLIQCCYVYSDEVVQNHNHFDLKAWVTVSDDFDVTRITKAIFQSVTSESCIIDNDLKSLQERLKKKSSDKKFLIVLDDVWNENCHDWTILQSPFLTRTPGSKIIMTTKSLAVSCSFFGSKRFRRTSESKRSC